MTMRTRCGDCGCRLNSHSVALDHALCGVCRGETDPTPRYRRLREALRHYTEFKQYVADTGNHVIEHKGIQISFYDLQNGIRELSPRKKEALYYNVILDWKQKDVAEEMGITTVSVGQYVDGAVQQLSVRYFSEMEEDDIDVE